MSGNPTYRGLSPSHDTFGSMRLVPHLWNGLGSTAFFLIAIAILAGGCNHPRSKEDGGDAKASLVVSKLSPSLAGKRIAIRGEIFMFKCGRGIQLDAGDVVCLADMLPKSGLDDPYAGMYEKPLDAIGILRYYHDSAPLDAARPFQWQHDHYYFAKETTQIQLITNYIDNTIASPVSSQLSALVGKRITIRGKLLGFKCGLGIQLDDEETVCLEQRVSKSVEDPYPGMYEKPVEATGTLRFFHDSTPMDETTPSQRAADHYYFETETTEVRLIPN